MPQITLNSKQVVELAEFIKKHDLKTFFVAKDQGAYVGACGGSKDDDTFENIIFYFRGCNPDKDEDWYDTAHYMFGGDDFGEHLDAEFILTMAEKIEPKVTIKLTATQIKMDGTSKKMVAPTEPKPSKPTAPKVKQTKGEQIMDLLKAGVNEKAIVKMVGTTLNSVRWYKSKMHKEAA